MNSDQFRYVRVTRDFLSKIFYESFDIELNSDVALFIACQSALETDYGSSDVYLYNHNLFGMRKPSFRPSLAVGVRYNHAEFGDSIDSVIDYFWWMLWNKFSSKSFSDLVVFQSALANSGFNPSSKYVDTISSIVVSFLKFESDEHKKNSGCE